MGKQNAEDVLKGSSWEESEMIPEEKPEHQEQWKNKRNGTYLGKCNRPSFPLEFFRRCLMVERKIKLLWNVVFNVCRGNATTT